MTDQGYLLDNAWQQGRARLDAVEAFLDPGTMRVLAGLGVKPGWRCLEVGAGGGSVAAWLAGLVGPDGVVVATDLDTRHLVGLAGLGQTGVEVRRHDVVTEALDAGAFDLVHARLVLEHLPERAMVLGKLAQAVRPGGWLVVEAVDYVSAVPVSEIGAAEHARSQAVRLRVFAEAGLDAEYGRRLPAALRAAGLVDVGNEGRVCLMEGGSAGARWFGLSMRQVRARLVGPGKLSEAEVDRMLALFEDPGWAAMSPVVMACWGRRTLG
jgi:SAM-dependent methyltransferase